MPRPEKVIWVGSQKEKPSTKDFALFTLRIAPLHPKYIKIFSVVKCCRRYFNIFGMWESIFFIYIRRAKSVNQCAKNGPLRQSWVWTCPKGHHNALRKLLFHHLFFAHSRQEIHMRELTHVENTHAWINSLSTILTGISKNRWEKSSIHALG